MEYVYARVRLRPGEVIKTGTAVGIRHEQRPPRDLIDGDRVEATTEGIGTLRNRSVLEEAGRPLA